MELYVLDKNLKVLGTIDKYECLIWTRNYYKPGNFSMQIIPNFHQFALLKKGNILLKRDASKEAMYIDYRQLKEDVNGVENLEVKGYSLSKWLDRRITMFKELQVGNAETVIRNYVDSNCINSKDLKRNIQILTQGINNNLGPEISYNSHYKSLIQEVESISKANELGYRVDVDIKANKCIFEVFQGLDRTSNQSDNPRAIFSSEFENVSNQIYVESDNNYRNMALVAGAGEDLARKTLSLGTENEGLDRYEFFVDARDISDKENKTRMVTDPVSGERKEETYEVDIPLDRYNKLLEARGIEKLSECTKIETFDCVLDNVESLVYRKDFDLGDKVSIKNKRWGLVLHERITSVEETYSTEGLNIKVDIGNNVPNLIDKISQKLR